MGCREAMRTRELTAAETVDQKHWALFHRRVSSLSTYHGEKLDGDKLFPVVLTALHPNFHRTGGWLAGQRRDAASGVHELELTGRNGHVLLSP